MTGTATSGIAASGWPAPAPGPAPLLRRVTAQAALELRILARNGEQLLLTVIIPVLLLVAFGAGRLVRGAGIGFLVPGILALAVLSTSFTSLAIGTGFERRYGVLKRLGTTPLSRGGLIGAKAITVAVVELGQAALILVTGLLLGWRPDAAAGPAVAWASTVALMLAGSAALSGLGLLLAGTLRAEATLAVANLTYLVLLGLGGILFPLARFPAAMRPALRLLPSGALSDGLHAVLQHGAGLPVRDLLVLCGWAVASVTLAARLFRWE